MDNLLEIVQGNALDLSHIPDESVHVSIFSPPYFGLRDYGAPWVVYPLVEGQVCSGPHDWKSCGWRSFTGGTARSTLADAGAYQKATMRRSSLGETCSICGAWRGELGAEPTPDLYIHHLVQVCREVRRVLHPTGTLWIVIDDSRAGNRKGSNRDDKSGLKVGRASQRAMPLGRDRLFPGIKAKDLIGIPFMLAFALRADGWYWRSIAPWVKRASMPNSAGDRPSDSVEYVLMFSKSRRYFFDMEAVKRNWRPGTAERLARGLGGNHKHSDGAPGQTPHTLSQPRSNIRGGGGFSKKVHQARTHAGGEPGPRPPDGRRHWRTGDLWFDTVGMLLSEEGETLGFDVNPQSYSGDHYAAYPELLVEPMILAATSERGVCPECLAPWVRVFERTPIPDPSARGSCFDQGKTSNAQPNQQQGERFPKRAVGWKASCPHADLAPIPATVLDPFAGTGTTGRVAVRLGRRARLVELQPDYLPQAEARTSNVQIKMPDLT